MRLLITNVSFYPAYEGGPTNALYWLASGLVHSGYDVCVVTTGRGIQEDNFLFDTWQKKNGFDVIYVKNGNFKKTIKEELQKSDVYLACGVCTLWGFYIRMKALVNGKKIIISPRGDLFDSAIDHKGIFYGFLKRFFFQIMRVCYGDKVVYHVTSEEEEIVVKNSMKSNRVYVVPNLMILPERVMCKNVATPYFLFVGRINPIKAIDKLILGLYQSSSFMKSNIILKIAGEGKGEYYEQLCELVKKLEIESKIIFVGSLDGFEKNKTFSQAYWTFLVSESENFGNVVLESLCQGTPVVASKGTPWKKLEETNSGFWIDNTPDSIAKKVNEIIEMNQTQYEIIRENAYRLSRTFDVYENIDKWRNMLDR